jgi:hypothetical protein
MRKLIISALIAFLTTKSVAQQPAYYHNYLYTTGFSAFSGESLVLYGVTAALDNSVKRDSLEHQMNRYKYAYPSATIKVVISTDTSIYTQINKIQNFQISHEVSFDGYNLEREFWNGAGTAAQYYTWLRLIKNRLGSVECYLGTFTQTQSDSITKYVSSINLHYYFTIAKWSGQYCMDNDKSRLTYLARSAYKNSKYITIHPLFANNEKSNFDTGFQTQLLDSAIEYCTASWSSAYSSRTFSYKDRLVIGNIIIYKKKP